MLRSALRGGLSSVRRLASNQRRLACDHVPVTDPQNWRVVPEQKHLELRDHPGLTPSRQEPVDRRTQGGGGLDFSLILLEFTLISVDCT